MRYLARKDGEDEEKWENWSIKDAIQAYLGTVEELSKDKESRYVEVG